MFQVDNTAVRSALLAAADYIEKYGWKQGMEQPPLWDHGKPCCLVVAYQMTSSSALWRDVHVALVNYLRPPADLIAAWNDTPGRTVAEVLAALRGAAAEVLP